MLYVAYGSNMNLEQMAYRCPNSEVVCNGKLSGYKLVFNKHADVLECEDKSKYVPVVVWEINDEDDWDSLDGYEGYPDYYIRKEVEVELDNGSTEKAIVYVMHERLRGIYVPKETTFGFSITKYFNTIKEGYIANGIDTDYLEKALEYSKRNKTEYNKDNPRY